MTQPFTAPLNGERIPIAETLQAELVEITEGRAVLRYPFLTEYTNPMGQLQGGMYGVMMDSAMAMAAGGIATATLQISNLPAGFEGFADRHRRGGKARQAHHLRRARGAG